MLYMYLAFTVSDEPLSISPSSSPSLRIKKVSVPGTVFAAVVGKNSSHLAFIKQATNTHIEIERTSKTASTRTLSIRYMYMYMYMCCFVVCLTLLASFFLTSHLSFKNMYTCTCKCYFALFVCLTLLASFCLTSHLSLNMYSYTTCTHVHVVECRGFESHLRQLIFLRKSDCLGYAVLLCLVVCLTLLASFFLPSHLSLKHVHMYTTSLGSS